MKIRFTIAYIILCLISQVCRGQYLNSKIVMTIDGKAIEAGEFIRMYEKSKEPGVKPDPDKYLEQFILYKLKVADAVRKGYDTTRAFITELGGYREQLAQNYLTDTKTKERLIQKAYQRSQTEINAWHILVAIPGQGTAEDTMRAWKKAIDIRVRLINGEPFESVARGSSDDKSVKTNGGNLGYFSVFQMIMPFEDAVYALKKGAISMPVRTPYGYHIIRVADKRPAKGKIKVAHIMKAVPPGSDDDQINVAKASIDSIYRLLQEGRSFSSLALKYSDHHESAQRGGELDWFGAGDIISDFAEAAFSLSDTGKYTKPVRTIYGWHIIKLLGKKALGSLEEMHSYLESRINQSYLNSASKKSFIDQLKKEYNYQLNKNLLAWFISNTDTLLIKGLKKYDRSMLPPGDMYKFAAQHFTTNEFADFIEKNGSMIVTKDSSSYISKLLDLRINDDILRYENSLLEKKYADFRYLMNEFRDGMLLFDISDKLVWNRVNTDTVGLQNYYEAHKNNWLSQPAVSGRLYRLNISGAEKSWQTMFTKYSKKGNSDDALRKKYNNGKDTVLTITSGKWYKGENKDIDERVWEPGTQFFSKDGFPCTLVIEKVWEREPLKFSEVKGFVMTGFQEQLENEWNKQLKASYTVKLDSLVFEEIRRKTKNE
jgi:peptidyl-prolyl cis-trans isomerase SurA